MTINLDDHLTRAALVKQIYDDVEDFCKREFTEPPRKHLGASIIGHPCTAYGWATFRWLKQENPSGQMFRLYNRGHLEEPRFVRWLEGIGFEVREIDPETQKQYRIGGCKGHFGGSLDALFKPPARYNLPTESLIWLGEFKTHSEKSFTKLAGKENHWTERHIPRKGGQGVRMAKPQHYKQMCSYGRAYGFHWGLYCAVNKNTDELYFEIVKLDWHEADDLFRKADNIVFSQTMPHKISNTSAYQECKICHFSGICHKGEMPTKNCRSCKLATPVDDGKWFCNHPEHNREIPDEVIYSGCGYWNRIV